MGFSQALCGFVSYHLLDGNPSKFFDRHGPFAAWFVPRAKVSSFEAAADVLASGLEEAGGFAPEGTVVRALSTRQNVRNLKDLFDRRFGQSESEKVRETVDEYVAKLDVIDRRAREIIGKTVAAHGPAISASKHFNLMQQRFHHFRSDLLEAFNPAAADMPAAALVPRPAPRVAPLQL